MRQTSVNVLVLLGSVTAGLALFLSISNLLDRTDTNRRLIKVEDPIERAKSCAEQPRCYRLLPQLVDRGRRENREARRRQKRKARERSATDTPRRSSRPSQSTPARFPSRPGTSPQNGSQQSEAVARPPAQASPVDDPPSAQPTAAPAAPPAEQPRPAVDVRVPLDTPSVCTPVIGVNC